VELAIGSTSPDYQAKFVGDMERSSSEDDERSDGQRGVIKSLEALCPCFAELSVEKVIATYGQMAKMAVLAETNGTPRGPKLRKALGRIRTCGRLHMTATMYLGLLSAVAVRA